MHGNLEYRVTDFAEILVANARSNNRGNTMSDYDKIHSVVQSYVEAWLSYYDVPEIVEDLSKCATVKGSRIASIEYSGVIAPYEFVTIIQSHEID